MEKEIKKPKIRIQLVGFIILAIIFGFFAGIFGEFITRYYLSNFAFFRDLYFTETSNLNQGQIIIREPRKVVVEQALRLAQIKSEVQPSVMKIYSKKRSAKNLLDKIVLPDDYLGQAVVLTSDGWLMTIRNPLIRARESLITGSSQKIYEVEKVVEDEATKIMFIKINAQNLPVAKLADFDKITDGEQSVVYNGNIDGLNLVNIQNKKYKDIKYKYDFISNIHVLDKFILLDKSFNSDFNGSPIFNFQSELIGFLTGQDELINQAIPINYISPIINQVLKGEAIKRPYLGINYLDLSKVYGLEEIDRQNVNQGAMIWPNERGVSIMPDSPLYNKLGKGDIIISLENQILDANNDLTDLLLQYKSGQDIRIRCLHEQKEAELSLTLK